VKHCQCFVGPIERLVQQQRSLANQLGVQRSVLLQLDQRGQRLRRSGRLTRRATAAIHAERRCMRAGSGRTGARIQLQRLSGVALLAQARGLQQQWRANARLVPQLGAAA
jgi:hypothetical protein